MVKGKLRSQQIKIELKWRKCSGESAGSQAAWTGLEPRVCTVV